MYRILCSFVSVCLYCSRVYTRMREFNIYGQDKRGKLYTGRKCFLLSVYYVFSLFESFEENLSSKSQSKICLTTLIIFFQVKDIVLLFNMYHFWNRSFMIIRFYEVLVCVGFLHSSQSIEWSQCKTCSEITKRLDEFNLICYSHVLLFLF